MVSGLDATPPTNARANDVFDVFHFKHYSGPNPYLQTAAFVFDFALSGNSEPLPIRAYVDWISQRFPHFRERSFESHAELFAQTAVELGKLEMELRCDRHSLKPLGGATRIAVESLHESTSRGVIYAVWDWFEDISRDYKSEYDLSGTIGKRYRRQDEIGTPYCITVDFDTLTDHSVTVRDRDSMVQERIAIASLKDYLKNKFNF